MKKVRLAACAVALTVGGLTPLGLSPAAADTATTATAEAFGVNLDVAGEPVLEREGLAESVLPPGGNTINDLVLAPVEPVATSGTVRGQATTSAESTIVSLLDEQVQAVPGPYNTRAVGQVDDLAVVQDLTPGDLLDNLELALVSADTVRAEAVGVCRNGQALYSGNSEIANLEINNVPLGLDNTIGGLLDTVNDLLSPLAQVADIDRNVVTPLPNGGVSVDALVVTVAALTGGEPLIELVVGHAEVGGLQCPPRPECSDTQDNDGDGKIDAQDPGCINDQGVFDPNDDDETDRLPRTAAVPNNPNNSGGGELPRTGGTSTAPLAGGLAVLALGALTLRRRSQAAR